MNRTLNRLFYLALTCILACGCTPDSPPPVSVTPPATGQAESSGASGVEQPADDGAATQTKPESTSAPAVARFTEKIPATLVEFDMILVPGDNTKSQKEFYIGKTEVTWDEFGYWALCQDLKEKNAILAREKKLRPSAPHDTSSIYRGWGRDHQPVVGVSRLSAEQYCAWLSEQTGKSYRLPTEAEWKQAFVAGGGQLDAVLDAADCKQLAWCSVNSLDEETFDNRAMPVASLLANQLGIFDMLGNVSEWVAGEGDERVAVGGNFLTTPAELNGNHRAIEDQSVWNKNYPNEPKSIWWFVDADYVGFRVVCDVP